MELREALNLLISGGGGAVVYWLMEHVEWLANLPAREKRYASLCLSIILPVLAWGAAMAMGYMVPPETWQGCIERIFALSAGAMLVSQGVHGAVQMQVQRAQSARD